MQKRTMFHIFVLILVFPFLVAECPTNSQKWMDKCFYFISKPVSFNDANLECKNAYNGNLVSIHDGFTNSWINTQANNFFHNSSTSELWIGANGTSSSWTWTDGSASDFSDWGHQASYGNCGAMNSVNGLWNWENCSGARPFVCETDSTTTTTTPSTQACPSDWFYFRETNSCYYWTLTNKYNWSQAEEFCEVENAHLVSLHSSEELNFLRIFFRALNTTNIWVGLFANTNSIQWNTVWQWTDASEIDYAPWRDEKPTFNTMACVVATNDSTLMQTYCYWTYYALCKKPSNIILPTPKPSKPTHRDCLEGWTYFEPTNSCYFFKTANATTHEKAEEFCVQKGGHLASIHSVDELDFVKTFANIYPWIGLYTNDTSVVWNSTWYWTDGSKFDYVKWSLFGMPNLDKESCVYLSYNYFQNVDCSLSTPFAVCKTKSNNIIATTTTLTPTIGPNQNCSEGWTYYAKTHSCYIMSSNMYSNWSTSEGYCALRGGHLASIHSEAEFAFLNNTILHGWREGPWVGLYTTDNPVEWNSTWYWSDNSKADYFQWVEGIPSFDGKLCTMPDGYMGFVNENCSKNKTALCKAPAFNAVPTSSPSPMPVWQCPSKWKYFTPTNSCYIATKGDFNWTTANEYCASYNSHLASIHSNEEKSFVYNFCYQCVAWIGLYSDDNAIMWKWTDDSPFDYPDWSYDYPVRGGPSHAALVYPAGFKNSYASDKLLPGICKRASYQA